MDEWNVVSRKRGVGRRLIAPYLSSASPHHLRAGAPSRSIAAEDFTKVVFNDLGIVDNEEEEEKIVGRIQRAIVKVEQSSFYEKFTKQMDELQVMEKLVQDGQTVAASEVDSVLVKELQTGVEVVEGAAGGEDTRDDERQSEMSGSSMGKEEEEMKKGDEAKVEMILYGVGSIHTAEIARCQLALALLIKRKLSLIGQLLVYDPIMTPIECRVMRTLGCVPLEINDNGRKSINGPTLFYMPYNEVELYDSVVRTSLDPFKLNQIVIIGNSFRTYSERWTTYPIPDGNIPSYLLKMQEFVEEIPIADDFYPSAFNDTSWHLFFNVEARLFR